MTFAVCVNASWAPAGPSLSVSGPWGAWNGAPWAENWGAHAAAPWGAWNGAHAAVPWGAAPWAASAHWGAHWGAPAAVVAAHAPAAIHAYAPAHGATYTAANRGSAHSAPLPGHAVSVKSINTAPAPGTW